MVDQNVGKLTQLLRMLGFDSVFFEGDNDTEMVKISLDEKRVLLTRDTHIRERNLVTSGKVQSVLINDETPDKQILQVVAKLNLNRLIDPFSLCLECNTPLTHIDKEEIEKRVPPYVFRTQNEFVECPRCHRVYWKGTHWNAMSNRITRIKNNSREAEE